MLVVLCGCCHRLVGYVSSPPTSIYFLSPRFRFRFAFHTCLSGSAVASLSLCFDKILPSTFLPGHSFPEKLSSQRSLPYGDSFLLIGGEHARVRSKAIYKYNPETEDWTKMKAELSRGLTGMAVMFVRKDSFKGC